VIVVIFLTNMLLIAMIFYLSAQIAEVYEKVKNLEELEEDEQKTIS